MINDNVNPAMLPPPLIIATNDALREVAAQLQHESLIACDTESNSLFAYKERVCLIQLSTRHADYLIDPLAISDLEPLRPIFADPAIEKVFHAAEYDVMCVKRDFGFTFANLFDTMFAARVIGRKAFGLGALLEEFFGVQADKRFQRADWSLRPLPDEQLQYAQQDTHYLPQIRDHLRAEIEASGQMQEAREVFDSLISVPPADNQFDPDGYWRINAARDFGRRQMAILRELYLWRDATARRRDCPPFKIMSDSALGGLVLATPHTMADLFAHRELTPTQARRFGLDILKAILRGTTAPLPKRPERPPRIDPLIQARYDALHQWRKERAHERGVESDIILSKESMWAMARQPPADTAQLADVPALGPWRREKYGAELVRVANAVTLEDVAQQAQSTADQAADDQAVLSGADSKMTDTTLAHNMADIQADDAP